MNAPILLGGAAILAFLLSSSKKSTTSSNGGNNNNNGGNGTKDDTKNNTDDPKNDGKGDLGEPAGPNGCAPGLIIKDGICVNPSSPDNGNNNNGNNNQGQGNLKTSDLYVSKDCKTVKFGDSTGESWWKVKAKKVAQQYLTSGYTNSLVIAYYMLQNIASCLKAFPMQENYETRREMEDARIYWVQKNKPAWALLFWLRNKIEDDFFEGRLSLRWDIKLKDYVPGKKFDWNAYWEEFLKPQAQAAYYVSEINWKQLLLPSFYDVAGDVKNGLDDQWEWWTTAWLAYFITPNITDSEFKTLWDKKLRLIDFKTTPAEIYQINDAIDDLVNDELDVKFDFEEE